MQVGKGSKAFAEVVSPVHDCPVSAVWWKENKVAVEQIHYNCMRFPCFSGGGDFKQMEVGRPFKWICEI